MTAPIVIQYAPFPLMPRRRRITLMHEPKPPGRAFAFARARETPAIFVVDRELRVVFHNAQLAGGEPGALSPAVATAVRQLQARLAESGESTAIAVQSPTEIVRVMRLEADGGASHFVVMLERVAGRNSVAKAARRFALSTRETEVLEGLLRGESTKEIAHRLGIGTTTVLEYIRKLGEKTNVRKRSEIVATVFGLR